MGEPVPNRFLSRTLAPTEDSRAEDTEVGDRLSTFLSRARFRIEGSNPSQPLIGDSPHTAC